MCRLIAFDMTKGRTLTVYSEEVGTKVLVKNVHYDLTKEDLEVRTIPSIGEGAS